MNYAVIGRILSWVLRTEGLLMLLPCLIASFMGSGRAWSILPWESGP